MMQAYNIKAYFNDPDTKKKNKTGTSQVCHIDIAEVCNVLNACI